MRQSVCTGRDEGKEWERENQRGDEIERGSERKGVGR